jgi:YHS domain-containing protein
MTLRTLRSLLLAAVLTAITVASAAALDKASTRPVNTDGQNVAIHGYDPVAYFTQGKPVQGSRQFAVTHGDATYHFSSAANRDAFAAAPARYLPAYGGFCAYGVVLGKKFDVDPEAWKVVDGRLYLNLNKKIQATWLADVPGNIAKAETNWPTLKDRAPRDL